MVIVTLNKEFKTSYGLPFKLVGSEYTDNFEDYDKAVARRHVANVGVIIVSEGEPLDNEYDLEEIYSMIEKGECV